MKKSIRIYQVNKENKNGRNIMFADYSFLKENNMLPQLDWYNKVWEGEHTTSSEDVMEMLDEIFGDFNIRRPKDFKGHRLSTSDIVYIDGKYYYCDSYGWQVLPIKDEPKTKIITSEELGKWIATFHKFSTEEEYRERLHAIRCIFNANENNEFWIEACEYAKTELNK